MKLNLQHQKNHYANLGKAAYCSVGFLILFIALNPSQNVYTQIMAKNNLEQFGFFCYSLDYFSYGIGCLAASYILDKLGSKISLSISATADALWILAILPPAYSSEIKHNDDSFFISDGFIYTTQILIQAIQGFLLGLKWVAGSKYVSECASEETKGFFASFFWGIYMISMVLGSLIAAFVSMHFKQSSFLLIMAAIALFSVLIFATLVKPIPQERHLVADNEIEDIKVLQSLSSDNLKNLETNDDLQSIHNFNENDDDLPKGQNLDNSSDIFQTQKLRKNPITLRQELCEIFILIKSKKMRTLIPFLLWIGTSSAVYTGILVMIVIDTQSIGDDQYKFSQAMLTMVSFGAGEIVGSISTGIMIDKYGNKKTAMLNIFFVLIQSILMAVYLINYQFSWFTYVVTFAWGLQDSSSNTLSIEILGFEFSNNSQSYAVSNLGTALGGLIFNIIEGNVEGRESYLIYTSIVGLLGIICNITTLFFKFKPISKDLKYAKRESNFNQEDK
ncbi:major facilitator superfamily protein [Stylonychia lemnae]|uniref:Major facilitator superfamily protein n=1 Tax=Stylonychia lemnae TaxID=5949 RepID=A0A078AEG6_STYLE|nr:major facilitator superfamily protein [Stylonychia lemnae]|eukprot:CDW80605.1 major facilitator superfamily protein [Stylonychia lemnae]